MLAGLAILGGCSASPSQPSSAPNFDTELIAQALVDAKSEGADASQVDLLTAAASTGSVTFDQAQRATDAMLACVEDAGFTVGNRGIDETHGLKLTTFTVAAPSGLDESQADAIYADCETKYRRWVEYAYENQPAARDAFGAQVEQHRAEIIACLRRGGSDIKSDAPVDEMVSEALRISTEAIDAGEKNVTDCFYEAGLTL